MWHSRLTQACSRAPITLFFQILLLPLPLFLWFLSVWGQRSVLKVAVHDTCTCTQAFSVGKGCSGRQRAKWPSVSGALVMCWWYSLWGMCRRAFPSLVWWIPTAGSEHECKLLEIIVVPFVLYIHCNISCIEVVKMSWLKKTVHPCQNQMGWTFTERWLAGTVDENSWCTRSHFQTSVSSLCSWGGHNLSDFSPDCFDDISYYWHRH